MLQNALVAVSNRRQKLQNTARRWVSTTFSKIAPRSLPVARISFLARNAAECTGCCVEQTPEIAKSDKKVGFQKLSKNLSVRALMGYPTRRPTPPNKAPQVKNKKEEGSSVLGGTKQVENIVFQVTKNEAKNTSNKLACKNRKDRRGVSGNKKLSKNASNKLTCKKRKCCR